MPSLAAPDARADAAAVKPEARVGTRPAAPAVPLIRRLERMTLCVAVVLVLGIHLVNLISSGPLWRDEIGDAVYAAMPSWSHIWSMLKYDNFPPLLLVLLRTWHGLGLENLGGPDIGYRIFGLLVGLALLAAFWLNARWLGGPRHAPWFSLPLFAAGGFMVRIGDSIRPYGPGWLFMLLTFGLIWRVVQAPRRGRIAVAALVAILSVQSLYQNAFMLFAIGTAAMLVAARVGRWRAVVAVAGIGALAALSLVPYALGPVHDANAWSQITRPGLPWSHMSSMLWNAAGGLHVTMSWFWLVAAGAVAWAAYSLPRAEEEPDADLDSDLDSDDPLPDARMYAAVSVAIAFPVYLGFLKALGMITTPWYYLLPLALTATALDVFGGLMAQSVRWRIARLAFLIAALCVALPIGWTLVQVRVTNGDAVAGQITRLAAPGDYVIVCPWPDGVSFHYYYHGNTPWTTLPPMEDNSIHRYDLMKERMTSADPIASVMARLGETLHAGHRVWIVGQIVVPAEGKDALVLKPAPNDPRVEWDEASYARSWALQVGGFLRAHASRASDARPHLNQHISNLENMDLACVEGWQP